MLGAILTALSGMDAYSDGLQTISNNVANLNTSGFKEAEVSFNELVNTGGSEFPGAEDEASGYGVSVASPMTDFTQGQLQQTDSALDLAIQGSGFLTVYQNGAIYYERTGSFSVTPSGNIADQNGNNLAVLNAQNQPTELNIKNMETYAPVATTSISFTGDLSDATTDTATTAPITVYDSDGGQHAWTVTFTNPTADSNGTGVDWTATVTDSNGTTVGTGTIDLTNGGIANPAQDSFTVNETVTGAAALSVSLDFSGLQSFSTNSNVQLNTVNGNGLGTLTSVAVDASGQVQITYSNGQTQSAGYIALANFQDPQTLHALTGGIYKSAANNYPQYFQSDAPGIGTLEASELEASNTNLSSEFGDLILIERGFQACSQVVSISNDMIQSLFGIQGQGGA